MSHFLVMVIGNDPEKQLEKYDESIEVDPYVIEIGESTKTRMINWCAREYNFKGTFEECCEKYSKDWNEDYKKEPLTGRWVEVSTYNPNSKYDYYELGGRWGGFITALKNKPNISANQALFGDIDTEAIIKQKANLALADYRKIASLFDNNIIPKVDVKWLDLWKQLRGEKKRIDILDIYNSQPAVKLAHEKIKETSVHFDIDNYQMTEEEYVKYHTRDLFSVFAVVKDGKWYDSGTMGWFGMSSNNKPEEEWSKEVKDLMKDLSDDTLISFYDCHI